MKYIGMTIISLMLFFAFLVYVGSQSFTPAEYTITDSQEAREEDTSTVITVENKSYRVYLQKINPHMITLIPNFTQKKSSQMLVTENNCVYGANGGFYTKESKPLGTFYLNGKNIPSAPGDNAFLNGYLTLTESTQLEISKIPSQQPYFIIQSGPLFTPSTQLSIKDDESARRMLIGKTVNNQFYFLAIVEKDNTHSGPLLAELPAIIDKLNMSQFIIHNSKFITLLNLDGGSASAFYGENTVRLEEITPIGSFLCGKNITG